MSENCHICGMELDYSEASEEMSCALCGKRETSTVRCRAGHYVCDACHAGGMGEIVAICAEAASRDPLVTLERLMARPACHMHGPEHHVMVGASLISAYRASGGDVDLTVVLPEMARRGSRVPGGVCGAWGACGAAISAGMFVSIVTGATGLKRREWSLSNRMTSLALARISSVGGPRCCKRDSYAAVQEAAAFSEDVLGVTMERTHPRCSRSAQNEQCISARCPYVGA